MTSSSQHLSWVKLCSSCVSLIIWLLSAFVLSTVYQLFICLPTVSQLFINFHQHFTNMLSTFSNVLSTLPTFYQLFINVFINFLSTFYQLFINCSSTFYQLFINFFINLEEMITFDICETLFALLPGHTMFLVGQSLSILFPGVLVSPPMHFWTRCSWSTSITAIV